jgi:hypothetical protein
MASLDYGMVDTSRQEAADAVECDGRAQEEHRCCRLIASSVLGPAGPSTNTSVRSCVLPHQHGPRSPCFLARLFRREPRQRKLCSRALACPISTGRVKFSGNSQPGTRSSSTWTVEGVGAQLRLRHIKQCTGGIGHIYQPAQQWLISAGVITYDQNKSDGNAPRSLARTANRPAAPKPHYGAAAIVVSGIDVLLLSLVSSEWAV